MPCGTYPSERGVGEHADICTDVDHDVSFSQECVDKVDRFPLEELPEVKIVRQRSGIPRKLQIQPVGVDPDFASTQSFAQLPSDTAQYRPVRGVKVGRMVPDFGEDARRQCTSSAPPPCRNFRMRPLHAVCIPFTLLQRVHCRTYSMTVFLGRPLTHDFRPSSLLDGVGPVEPAPGAGSGALDRVETGVADWGLRCSPRRRVEH